MLLIYKECTKISIKVLLLLFIINHISTVIQQILNYERPLVRWGYYYGKLLASGPLTLHSELCANVWHHILQ